MLNFAHTDTNTMSAVFRALSLSMGVFFTLAAIVQHNDRYWHVWMAIYAIPAATCVTQTIAPQMTQHFVYHIYIRAAALFYAMLTVKKHAKRAAAAI